jgi:tetratricopeptide (TPR) repeat protein
MVLQTVAYALDRPGMLLAPRRPVERPGAWRRLVVRPDPGGQPAGRPAPLEVTGALADDPERDLLVLHAPGLPACGHDAAGAAGPGTPLEAGQALVGLRDREGYRPRVFPAALERRLRLPGGPDLLLVRIPDGGGAPAGFLLDRRLRLVATILPPPPGADATLACAVPYEGAGGAGDPGGARPPRQAIESHRTPADEGPVGRLARALLLTRDDQALEAIALLDRVALEAGAFPDLWLERGIRRYRIGRTEAAAGDFAAAAVADPGMHLAHFNLGMALGTWGRYREAAEAFSRALRLRPDHAATLYHLALALHASGAVDRARGEVERLSSLDPGLAAALRPLLVP